MNSCPEISCQFNRNLTPVCRCGLVNLINATLDDEVNGSGAIPPQNTFSTAVSSNPLKIYGEFKFLRRRESVSKGKYRYQVSEDSEG